MSFPRSRLFHLLLFCLLPFGLEAKPPAPPPAPPPSRLPSPPRTSEPSSAKSLLKGMRKLRKSSLGYDFSLDATEVTTASYRACVRSGGCTPPIVATSYCNYNRPEYGEHPINCVSQPQADAFCRWAGKRLPTAAEWIDAASPEGSSYPWGEAAPTCEFAIHKSSMSSKAGCDRDSTAPVASATRGASPDGIVDLAGNVAEWTSTCPESASGSYKCVVLGGSWQSKAPFLGKAAKHTFPALQAGPLLGFRCAKHGTESAEVPLQPAPAQPPPPAALPRAYALLIGVGRYASSSLPPLSGPTHDVQRLQRLLTSSFNLPSERIVTLTNRRATRQAIKDKLTWLAQNVSSQDPVLLYFSGYGTQVPSSPESPDFDDALVPFDASSDPSSLLRDRDLTRFLRKLPSKRITVILDSCFSASATRDSLGLRNVRIQGLSSKCVSLSERPQVIPELPDKRKNAVAKNPYDRGFAKFLVSIDISIRISVRPSPRPAAPAPAPRPSQRGRVALLLPDSLDELPSYDLAEPHYGLLSSALFQEASRTPQAPIRDLLKRANARLRPSYGVQWKVFGRSDRPLFPSIAASPSAELASPDPSSSLFRCTSVGFCAQLVLLNRKGQQTTSFRSGDEILFLVRLNRPGHALLLNVTQDDPPTLIFPDLYQRFLGQPASPSYALSPRQWHLFPPEGPQSQAYFKIEGKPATEYVELVVSQSPQSLRSFADQVRQEYQSAWDKNKRRKFMGFLASRVREAALLRLRIPYRILP